MFVPTFLIVTVAPGMAASDPSVTTPRTVAKLACPHREEQNRPAPKAVNKNALITVYPSLDVPSGSYPGVAIRWDELAFIE
jgi:hypothetical protein